MIPKLLSECGTEYIIDDNPNDKYTVQIEQGDYLFVCVGFNAKKAGARYNHPNISTTYKTIHEFKHYRANGGKFWTSHAGINHILIIPKNKVILLPEKGYSYVKAEINGVKVNFNVSGGTGNGWTDYLGIHTDISVNHKLSDLKKLCEVAIRNPELETFTIEKCDEARWNDLVASSNANIKEQIAKLIENNKKPVIKLYNASYREGIGIDVIRKWKKVITDENHAEWKPIGRVKELLVSCISSRYNVKLNQVDWHNTAVVNNIS